MSDWEKKKLTLYNKPGPHMWRLLFQERLDVPLPKAWHAWHLFVALLPGFLAWWGLSATRKHMAAKSEVLRLKEEQKEEEARKVVEKLTDERLALADEVAELKRALNELRQEQQQLALRQQQQHETWEQEKKD